MPGACVTQLAQINNGEQGFPAIAYLAFDGNCAEAMRFYEQALHAKLA